MDNRIRIMSLLKATKNVKELTLVLDIINRTEYAKLIKGIKIKK